MAKDPKEFKAFTVKDFTGGWNPRMTPLVLEEGDQGPMASPDLLNCDFSYPTGINKRLGKAIQGGVVNGQTVPWVSNLLQNTTFSVHKPPQAKKYAQKFVAASSANIANITLVCKNTLGGTAICSINADSAGVPSGSALYASDVNVIPSYLNNVTFSFPANSALVSGTTYWAVFTIPTITVGGAISQDDFTVNAYYDGATTGNVVFQANQINNNWSVQTFTNLYYKINAFTTDPNIQGLYDLRTGTSSITQNIIAAAGGVLYYKSGSTWTSIKSGLGSGQNVLFDFTTASNYMISCDYGNSTNQVWDASATGTMAHGYRLSPYYVASGTPRAATISSYAGTALTMSASQPASGLYRGKIVYLTGGATSLPETAVIQSFTTSGTVGSATYYVTAITLTATPQQTDRTTVKWNGITAGFTASGGSYTSVGTLTCMKLIGITQLTSGGYRCSDEISLDVTTATAFTLNLTNIAMNSSTDGTKFAFDIPSGATTWYMTLPFDPTLQPTAPLSGVGALYYRLQTAAISTALNPMTNATTSFNITNIPVTTANTPLIDTGFPQGFFTSQIDAPRAKYLTTFQGMVVSAGDPNFPNRVWFTAQGTSQVYSTYGGVLGAGLDIPVNLNDGQIIRGIKVWQGALYVLKNNSIYRISYTGNLGISPFFVDKLQGEIGCLSHWCVKETNIGLVFLSVQGPAVIYGSQVAMIPAASSIMNMFQTTDANSFNTASMIYSTGLLYSAKKQIWWGVSSNGATVRDRVLVYDYEKQIFFIDDGISANFFAVVGDANGFPQPWSGDYSAQIFRHDNGLDDNGSAINWYYSTPWMAFNDPFGKKNTGYLYISGARQSSGNLYVDEYLDFSTSVANTYTYDMTKAQFQIGIPQRLASQSSYARYVFRNSDLDVPVQITAVRWDVQHLGAQD